MSFIHRQYKFVFGKVDRDRELLIKVLDRYIDDIFKILYISESDIDSLGQYVESLLIDMKGSQVSFSELSTNIMFQKIINILNYVLLNCDYIKHSEIKREVFKGIDLIKKIIKSNGAVSIKDEQEVGSYGDWK